MLKNKFKNLFFSSFKKLKKLFGKRGLTQNKLIKFIYDKLYLILKPTEGVVQMFIEGNKFYVDSEDLGLGRYILLSEEYEPFEMEIFKKEIQEGMVVVDIGAHWGYYTLIAAKFVTEKGKVFAFEPCPKNYELLLKNIKENKYNNIFAFQMAISDKSGKIKLYFEKTNSVTPSLFNFGNKNFIEVESISLDDFFENKKEKVDIIKMDIEGWESAALEGMKKILEKSQKIKIFTEFNPKLLKLAGFSPEIFLNKLLKFGFKIFNIDEDKKKLEIAKIEELIKKYKGERYTNLLAVRE